MEANAEALAQAAQTLLGTETQAPAAEATPAQSATEQAQAANPLEEALKTAEPESVNGKPLNEHPRFKELIEQKNEFKRVADEYKGVVTELQSDLEDRSKLNAAFLEIYSKYQNPHEVLRIDNELAEAMSKLKDMKDPTVLAALHRVHEFLKPGSTKTAPQKPPTTSEADDRLAKILTQQWTSGADQILSGGNIRPELRTIIRDGALKSIDTKADFSEKKLVEAMQTFISSQGWDYSFVTGKSAKPANPPAAKGGSTTSTPAQQATATPLRKFEDIKDPAEAQHHLAQRFKSMMTEKGL